MPENQINRIMEILKSEDYKQWISEIKEKIRSSQIKASLSVNSEMLKLYWDLGKSISEKLTTSNWGTKIVEKLSIDLKRTFPDFDGFSKRNLLFMRQWFEFYQYAENAKIAIMKQVVSQFPIALNSVAGIKMLVCLIPWGHNIVIIQKTKNFEQSLFYILKTIENNWSRTVLSVQIDSQLFERQGKAVNIFQLTLPKQQSDLANETLKDPYKFDFLNLTEKIQERDTDLKVNHWRSVQIINLAS